MISRTVILLVAFAAVCAFNVLHAAMLYVGPEQTYTTIQSAIDAAEDGDTIKVAEGTYAENIVIAGKSLFLLGGWDAEFSNRDWEEHVTIIDGTQSGRCITWTDADEGEISGFTITNGLVLGSEPENCGGGAYFENTSITIMDNLFFENSTWDGLGGAIYVHEGSISILNNAMIQNHAGAAGGAIYINNSDSNVSGNIIGENTANSSGGGIYSNYAAPVIIGNTITDAASRLGGGIHANRGIPTISENVISANTASSWGGGIYTRTSNCIISGNLFCENTANYGGGIYLWYGSPTISGNRVSANTASSRGGGIYANGGDVTLISENWVTDNFAKNYGGGVYYVGWGTAEINGNMITHNISSHTSYSGGIGGGIHCRGTAIIRRNVVSENSARRRGGGISVEATGTPSIISNTVVGNTAIDGGGLALSGSSLVMSNSILWSNVSENESEIDVREAGSLHVNYSNIEGGQSAIVVDSDSLLSRGHGNIDTDPLFADPENGNFYLKSEYGRWDPKADDGNGAWVFDDITSPCIDAGDPDSDFSNESQPNGGRINMGAYGNTPEASLSPAEFWTLSVNSTPASGIYISGGKPGTTPYTAPCPNKQTIQLTAPTDAVIGGTYYRFIHWELDGIEQSENLRTIELDMTSDRTAIAVYEAADLVLSIESEPLGGIEISGDKPGTSPYEAACFPGEISTLNAPETATVNGIRYDFVCWKVDGVEQEQGANQIALTIEADMNVVAVYHVRIHTLLVMSAPVIGVEVEGEQGGVTIYSAECPDQEIAVLTVPDSLTIEGFRYTFDRWYINNHPMPSGQKTINLTMDADKTALALYNPASFIITAEAVPLNNVEIEVNDERSVDFSGIFDAGETVQLFAPGIATHDSGTAYTFSYWMLNGKRQQTRQAAIEFEVQCETYAQAVYHLAGDAYNDCTVDVVDLMFVRNNLGNEVNEVNWQADVNGDSRIDLLDLVYVRNRVGAECVE